MVVHTFSNIWDIDLTDLREADFRDIDDALVTEEDAGDPLRVALRVRGRGCCCVPARAPLFRG